MTMPDTLRAFNDLGRKKWAEYIDLLKSQPEADLPDDLLTDPQYALDPATSIGIASISLPVWKSVEKMEFARSLSVLLTPLRESRLASETWPGLWDWLTARYFDFICPKASSGKRKLHQREWYLFSEKYDRQYKHRVAGPVDLYDRHGDNARLLLASTAKSLLPSSLSQLEDEVSSRKDISSSPAAIAVLSKLYWDPEKQQQRRGAVANTMKPGTIRRFAAIFDQLERTFDLSVTEAEAILKLLPEREFARWLQSQQS